MDDKQFEEIVERLERLEAMLDLGDDESGEDELDGQCCSGECCCSDEPPYHPHESYAGPGLNERRMVDLIVHLVSERLAELLERRCDCHPGRRGGWERRGYGRHHECGCGEPDGHRHSGGHDRAQPPRFDEQRLVDLVTQRVSERVERAIAERLVQFGVESEGAGRRSGGSSSAPAE